MYPSTIHRILKKYHESGYTNDLTTEELVNTSKSDTNIDSNESDPTNLNDLDEQIFLKAAIHVKQTIDQRKLANSKIAEAKNTNYAYVYDESEGSKGGNNVALLILDYVQTNLVKVDQPQMKELNISMDNCVGQNKNRMVIRTAPYMIESGLLKM